MNDRTLPGWAEPVDATDTRRLVTCGGCGETMPWRTFALRHLQDCGGPDPARRGDGIPAAPREVR